MMAAKITLVSRTEAMSAMGAWVAAHKNKP